MTLTPEDIIACRTGCVTKDHTSYAECLRAGAPRIAYCNSANGHDFTKQKRLDADLSAYRDARSQGIQPSSTQRDSVDRAIAISDKSGSAYQA